jgi:2-hydroxychromene-2-carboxylate isomerase
MKGSERAAGWIRRRVSPRLSSWLISEKRIDASYRHYARRRDGLPELEFFFRVDDPRSLLMLQVLETLVARHRVNIVPRVVQTLPLWAHPAPELAANWNLADAAQLASHYGLHWSEGMRQPSAERARELATRLAGEEEFSAFCAGASIACRELWLGQQPTVELGEAQPRALAANEARLAQLKFYDSAAVYFEGEWYAGLDRLGYLDRRLGGCESPLLQARPAPVPRPVGGELEYFFSFRSPYSYLAMERVANMARDWGCSLRLSPVLPMVTRGMPVRAAKRRYIVLDAAREARALEIEFGHICDPLGTVVERCLALTYAMREDSQPMDLPRVLARAVFARGQDLSRDRVLRSVLEESTMTWGQAVKALSDESWRDWVAANRERLNGAGLWGVPCLRYAKIVCWGQDRLWVIEDALAAAATK